MKVKLLKKLRRRAHKEIGMLYFVDKYGRDTYNIGVRSKLTPDYDCSADVERELEHAKKRLAYHRRKFILKLVEDKWVARRIRRLLDKNKDIIKL